jgi:Colicin V production protein.
MGVKHASEGAAVFENFASAPSGLEAPIGFLIVFAVVQLAVRGISMMAGHVIGLAGMTSANRVAGGAFGAFKAALMASILLSRPEKVS